jgi:hypothetical protein
MCTDQIVFHFPVPELLVSDTRAEFLIPIRLHSMLIAGLQKSSLLAGDRTTILST